MIKKVNSERMKSRRKSISALAAKLLFLLIFSFILFTFIKIYNDGFKPILNEIASYRAEQLSVLAVNRGIIEVLSDTEIRYEDIVTITRKEDGTLTSLTVNLFKINELKSRFTVAINKIINEKESAKIYIPFGNITGVELFSGMGPVIPVELRQSGSTLIDFENTFTDAGVNQTRHTVLLKITSKISMLMPNNLYGGTETVTSVPIAESIIVGDVPDNFTVLETAPDTIKDDILNLN